jgi:hypothetical protein
MASKNISIYVTDRTMSSMRPGEGVSPRLNRIVDRYLEQVELDAEFVREQFTVDQWSTLVDAWGPLNAARDGVLAMNARSQLIRKLGVDGVKAAAIVGDLSAGDLFVLLELLEREYISRKVEAASVEG